MLVKHHFFAGTNAPQKAANLGPVPKTPDQPANARDQFQASQSDEGQRQLQLFRQAALKPELARERAQASQRLEDVGNGQDPKVKARQEAIRKSTQERLDKLNKHFQSELSRKRTHRQKLDQQFYLARARGVVVGGMGGQALEALLKKPGGKQIVVDMEKLHQLRQSGQADSSEAKKLESKLKDQGLEVPSAERIEELKKGEKQSLRDHMTSDPKGGYARARWKAGRGSKQELIDRFYAHRQADSEFFDPKAHEDSQKQLLAKENELIAKTESERQQIKSTEKERLERVENSTKKQLKRRLNRRIDDADLHPALSKSAALADDHWVDYQVTEDGLKGESNSEKARITKSENGYTVERNNPALRKRIKGEVALDGSEKTELRHYRSQEGYQTQNPEDLYQSVQTERTAKGEQTRTTKEYEKGKVEKITEERKKDGKVVERRRTRIQDDYNGKGVFTETQTYGPEGPSTIDEWNKLDKKGVKSIGSRVTNGDTALERRSYKHPDGSESKEIEVREKGELVSLRRQYQSGDTTTDTLKRRRKDGNFSIRESKSEKGRITSRTVATKSPDGKILHSVTVKPYKPRKVNTDVDGTAVDILSKTPQDIMSRLEGGSGKIRQQEQVVEVFDGKEKRSSYSATWTKGDRTLVKTLALDKYGMPTGSAVWKLQIQNKDGTVNEQTFYQGSKDSVVTKTRRQGDWLVTDTTIHPDRHLSNGFKKEELPGLSEDERKEKVRHTESRKASDLNAKDALRKLGSRALELDPRLKDFMKEGSKFTILQERDFKPNQYETSRFQTTLVSEDGRRLTARIDPETRRVLELKIDDKLKDKAEASQLVDNPKLPEVKNRTFQSILSDGGQVHNVALDVGQTFKFLKENSRHLSRKAVGGRVALATRGVAAGIDILER